MPRAAEPDESILEQEFEESVPRLSEEQLKEFNDTLEGKGAKYEAIDIFQDPVEMIYTLDENFREGLRSLHDWQINVNRFVARRGVFNYRNRLRLYIAACNGSGKDAYVITLLAIFLALSNKRHRVIITSASYTQMYAQTQSYIRSLANHCNKYFAALGICDNLFVIKKDHIVCTKSGSEIKMFVTDDPGRAEGYHPFPDTPGAELTVIVNEAKSVEDSIFTALKRCTFTRWIEVSSTGTMSGHFYSRFQHAKDLKFGGEELTTLEEKAAFNFRYRVTWKDCPHISEEAYWEDVEEHGGEESDLIKSKYWSIFVSADACVIISPEVVDRIFDTTVEEKIVGIGRRAGIDIGASADGDESSMCIIEENQIVAIETWRFKNTVRTKNYIIELLKKYNVNADNVFVDDGNIGRSVVDMLWESGWKVNRVLNQWSARNKAAYRNRGAELWFNVEKIFSRNLIGVSKLVRDDVKLRSQLSNRYYKKSQDLGKITLESKVEARANGRGSPDRADSLILAFNGLIYDIFLHGKRDEKSDKPKGANKYDVERFVKEVKKKKHMLSAGLLVKEQEIAGSRPADRFLMPVMDENSKKRKSNRNAFSNLRRMYKRSKR